MRPTTGDRPRRLDEHAAQGAVTRSRERRADEGRIARPACTGARKPTRRSRPARRRCQACTSNGSKAARPFGPLPVARHEVGQSGRRSATDVLSAARIDDRRRPADLERGGPRRRIPRRPHAGWYDARTAGSGGPRRAAAGRGGPRRAATARGAASDDALWSQREELEKRADAERPEGAVREAVRPRRDRAAPGAGPAAVRAAWSRSAFRRIRECESLS